jgi:GLPGLI family protein
MKNSLFLLFVIIYNFALSQNDSGIITYKKLSNQSFDSLQIDNSTKLKAELLKTSAYMNDFVYELKFKKNLAVSTELKTLTLDKDKLGINLARIFSGYPGKTFYNLKRKEIIIKKEFAGKIYDIKSNIDDIKWELTSEKKTIDKYNCLKAIGFEEIETRKGIVNLKIIAWYTPNIPVPFGPDGYAGLPGLILELERNNIITYASKIEFKDDIKLESLEIENLITKKDFNNIAKKLNTTRTEQN